MFNIIIIFTTFIITLATLITIHEAGHFCVARLWDVKVERFSIGFGKTIWKYLDKQGTEYIIALIPLGGYVKMLDERTDDVPVSMLHKTFNSKKIWQKATIIAAGPVANIIFAITVYCIILFVGIPTLRPIIGDVLTKSIAAEAQIKPNMEVKYIDNLKISDWDEGRIALLNKIGQKQVIIKLLSLNDNNIHIRKMNLNSLKFNPDLKYDPLIAVGIIPKNISIENIIVKVEQYSPASKAGLQVGDKIIAIDNKPLGNWKDFIHILYTHPGRIFILKVNRQGLLLQLKLIPEIYQNKGFIGFLPKVNKLSNAYKIIQYYNPIKVVEQSVVKNLKIIELTISTLIKILTGQINLNYLSGPISIAETSAISAKNGVISYLMFLSLISINLAIINMLPLPILDGGHLLFLFIEKMRGNPLSEEIQNFSYRISSILLLFLMVLVLCNDLSHILK